MGYGMNSVYGIILKVSYESMGDTSSMDILGKTMLDWVSISLDGAAFGAVDYSEETPLPLLVRPYLDMGKQYTAVLYSDTPLITKKTVADAVASLDASGQNVLKMTRGYIFRTSFLLQADKLYTDNTRYFDEEDFITAFNFKQVGLISDILRNRILDYHMERGVRFLDLGTAHVDADVTIGRGTVIGPNTILRGKTILKENVRILYDSVLEDAIVDEGVTVNSSRLYHCYIGANTTVGPFAYIRPDSVIGPDCRIGDFVEIKKSVIGEGCKVSHLSYVGDCEMGDGCNIGCGVVFVNYDGKNKFRTKVGHRVFVGSNSNIVAPMVIDDGAFIAAGSTLTGDVPKGALAIARARQVVKPDWTGNKFAPKDEGETT